ncbi:hypothetical protein [Armatimonas sp.]|uniref:hypothetical protein n=1 Tax=Armatimonas sp. TaxID=1872638 RepID=UPI00286C5E7F|nr:hypothetical protein [Armatimonas sp.]
MTIGIDLEGTLIAECGEFPCERTGTLAKLLYPNGVRTGARPLLRELTRAGHALTLYSSGAHKPWKLRLWCHLAGLPVRRVITLEQAKRQALKNLQKQQQRFSKDLKALGLSHFGKTREPTWPPCKNQDLILDDEPGHIQSAWRSGVKGVLVTNCEQDWTARIREATLQSPEIEVLTLQKKAIL